MIQVSLPVFIAIWTVIGLTVFITLVLIIKAIRRGNRWPLDKDYITNKKNIINKLLQGDNSTEYAMAIIEADKLLDWFLKSRHLPGETLGERLKMACYNNNELKKVWSAHLLRNRIVHDHGIELSRREALRYYKDYENAYNILSK